MKPIHKYNGGVGATLCNKCRVVITTGLTEDLVCEECEKNPDYAEWKKIEHEFYYKLRIGEVNKDESVFGWLRSNYEAPKSKQNKES